MSKTTDEPPTKRRKLDTKKRHYPSLGSSEEDQASQERNVQLLKQELEKKKINNEAVKSLMTRTFSERRKVLLTGGKLVVDLLKDYSFLKKAMFVSEQHCS